VIAGGVLVPAPFARGFVPTPVAMPASRHSQANAGIPEPVLDLTGPVDVVVQPAPPRGLAVPRALFGLCADLGPAPSAEEIDD